MFSTTWEDILAKPSIKKAAECTEWDWKNTEYDKYFFFTDKSNISSFSKKKGLGRNHIEIPDGRVMD